MFFEIAGLPRDAFIVTQLDCSNDALSSAYDFIVQCSSHILLDLAGVKLKKATLYWENGNTRHGIMTNIIFYNNYKNIFLYKITLSSPLSICKKNYHDRVFVHKTLNYIVNLVLESSGWDKSQWHCYCKASDTIIEYRIQYKQTDFDFLMELFTEFKLNFCFHQTESSWILKIIDNFSSLNSNPVAISSLNHEPVINYNKINHPDLTRVKVDNKALSPGLLVELTKKIYRIYNIEYKFNYIELILINPNLDCVNYINKPINKTRINTGLVNAYIESNDNHYPELDEKGCYYIKFLFDNLSAKTMGSPPIIMAQPGFVHFPFKDEKAIAVRFLSGNIHDPIIIGGFIDPFFNHSDIINHKTYAGHELKIDNANIKLMHLNTKNSINLTNDIAINALSDKGVVNMRAGNNLMITSKNNYKNILGSSYITSQYDYNVTVNNNIHLKSGKNIALQAENKFSINNYNTVCFSQNIIFKGNIKLSLNNNVSFNAGGASIIIDSHIACMALSAPFIRVDAPVITCPPTVNFI